MVGFFISGALYERIGAFNLFAISGLIALVGGLLFLLYVKGFARRPYPQS
jgi:hypothetical protein